MADSTEPIGAIALESRLAEETGHSDDSHRKGYREKKDKYSKTVNDAMVSQQRINTVVKLANYGLVC